MSEENHLEAVRAAGQLFNGTYTIAHPEHGHYTVKLHTAQSGQLQGRRILSLLVGPDNERDFRGVAFYDEQAKRANVWKRYASPDRREAVDAYHWGDHWNSVEKRLAILLDLALRFNVVELAGETEPRYCGAWGVQGYTLHVAGRCRVCNRKLTTPESIEQGIGPKCAERAA